MLRTIAKLPTPSAPSQPAVKRGLKAVFGLALALAAFPVAAIDWSFKAFGTVAAIGTDTDRIGFRHDYTQNAGATRAWRGDIDSRLGLQLDADFSHEFHAAVQWVARNHAGNFFEQNLEWAFLRWRPHDGLDLRLGRLGFDAFLLSDYRNVGYAYPWMRPPYEFYAPLFPYHFDGGDIAKKFSVGEGYLTLKSFAGYNLTQMQPSYAPVFSLESLMFGGSVVYESGNWRARLGYARSSPLNDWLDTASLQPINATLSNPLVGAVWPAAHSLLDTLSIRNKPTHYVSAGVAYDDGVWPIQAEAAYIDSNVASLPNMASAYLSVGRRFGSLTLYSLYGIAESFGQRTDVPGPLLPVPALLGVRDGVYGLLNNNRVDQQSLSLGLRYDAYENLAFKAQWSHAWLSRRGDLFWLEFSPPVPTQVNIWSFGMDFVY